MEFLYALYLQCEYCNDFLKKFLQVANRILAPLARLEDFFFEKLCKKKVFVWYLQ